MGRKAYKSEPSFLENNPEYYIQYYEFIKNECIWNNSGQYWLGQESQRRATAILNENIDEYKIQNHSEKLFFKTKKYL